MNSYAHRELDPVSAVDKALTGPSYRPSAVPPAVPTCMGAAGMTVLIRPVVAS